MTRTPTRPGRLRHVARAAALCAALAAGPALPQTLYWAPNGPVGGSGTWADGLNNWANSLLGISLPFFPGQPWSGAATTAVFAGAPGTVTVNSALAADSLQFLTGGFTLAGSGSVTVGNSLRSLNGTTTLAAQLRSAAGSTVALQGNFNLAASNVLAGSFAAAAGTRLTVQDDIALLHAMLSLSPGSGFDTSIDWGGRFTLYMGGLSLSNQTIALGSRNMQLAGVAGQTSVFDNVNIAGSNRSLLSVSGGNTLVRGSGGLRPTITLGATGVRGNGSLVYDGVDLNLPTASGWRSGQVGSPPNISWEVESSGALTLTNGTQAVAVSAGFALNTAVVNITNGSTLRQLAFQQAGSADAPGILGIGLAAGSNAVVNVDGTGSRLEVADAVYLGNFVQSDGSLLAGKGSLFLTNAATASTALLSFGLAGSTLGVGAGTQMNVGSFLLAGPADPGTTIQLDGTLVYGDPALRSTLITTGLTPSFAGVLAGGNTGLLRKVGPGDLTLANPASTFAGTVSVEGGRLNTSVGALQNARLQMASGTTLAFTDLTAGSVIRIGALDGSFDLDQAGHTLVLGGGGQLGSYGGRFTSGQLSIVKTGAGFQDFVRTGQAATFFAPYLSARGGITNLVGGSFDFVNSAQGSGTAATASLNVSDAGSQLRLVGGAQVTATTDVRAYNGGTLALDQGAQLSLRSDAGGRSLLAVGGSGTGQLTLDNGSVLSARNVALFAPNAGAPATMSVRGGARVDMGFLQFEAAGASLLVDGGMVNVDTSLLVRTAASSAVSIALSDPTGGGVALALGGNPGLATGDLVFPFYGAITDGPSGPGSIRKEGLGTLPLVQPLGISGRLIIDGGQVQPGRANDLGKVNVVLNSKDGLDFSQLVGQPLVQVGSLSGTADLTVPADNGLAFGFSGQNTTYSGRIDMSGPLHNAGPGTQTFAGGGKAAGFDVFGGTTVVDGGRWQMQAAGATGPAISVYAPDSAFVARGGAVIDLGPTGLVRAGPGNAAVPASITLTGPGTRVSTGDLRVVGNGVLTVSDGAALGVARSVSGPVGVNRGFVSAPVLGLSVDASFALSDAPQAPGTALAAQRTALTLVQITPLASPATAINLTTAVQDGASGAGGVTFSGSNFIATLGAAQTYTGTTIADGVGVFVQAAANQLSPAWVARNGGVVLLSAVGSPVNNRSFATDATSIIDIAGGSFFGAGFSGPGHSTSGAVQLRSPTLDAGSVLTTRASADVSGASVSGRLVVTAGGTFAGTVHAGGLLEVASAVGAGATTLDGGSLRVAPGGVLDVAGSVTANAGSQTRIDSGGTLTGSGSLVVNGGTVRVDGAATPAFLSAYGGRLEGTGRLGAVQQFGMGATWAPGLDAGSVGTLGIASLALVGGGSYEIDLADASAAAGVGYDFLSLGGALDLDSQALGSQPFTLALRGQAGMGFDATRSYRWHVLGAGSVTGYSPGELALDLSGFGAGYDGTFGLSVDATGVDIFYAPVPEPATWALMFGGVAGLLAWRRRTTAAERAPRRVAREAGRQAARQAA